MTTALKAHRAYMVRTAAEMIDRNLPSLTREERQARIRKFIRLIDGKWG